MFAQIGADLVERAGRDLGAVAQPRHQLAVVDDEAAEGRFRGPGRAGKIPDVGQDFFRGPAEPRELGLSLVLAPLLFDPHDFALFAASSPLCGFWEQAVGSVNHKSSGQRLWANAHNGWEIYLAGHSGAWLPSGTAGRAQNAGVFDSFAEWLTALKTPNPDGLSSRNGRIASPLMSSVFNPSATR